MKRFFNFLLISTFLLCANCAISQPPVQTKLHNPSGNSNPDKGKKVPSAKSIGKVSDDIKTPPSIDRKGEKILGLPVRNEQYKETEESNNNAQNKNDTIPSVSEVPSSKPPVPNIDNSKFPVHYSTEKSTTIVHKPQASGRVLKYNKQPRKGIKKKAHRVAAKKDK